MPRRGSKKSETRALVLKKKKDIVKLNLLGILTSTPVWLLHQEYTYTVGMVALPTLNATNINIYPMARAASNNFRSFLRSHPRYSPNFFAIPE